MTKIYFLRHGLSQLNAEDKFGGHTDTPLTDEGRQQAREAGEALKAAGRRFDLIVSSPLERALETAKLVAEAMGYPLEKIEQADLLKERNFGALEAMPAKEFFAGHIYQDIDQVPGAEKIEELQMRASSAMDWLRMRPEASILLVGHGAFGRAFLRVAAGHPYTHEYDSVNPWALIKNCQLIEVL